MKILPALKYLMVFFLFTAMSCKEVVVDKNTFKIGRESTFRINQIYTSTDGQYTLQITKIGDSRCPTGAVCDWQGEITLKGEWTDNKVKTAIELYSVGKATEKQPTGFNIQIVNAKPFPVVGAETKPEDLMVTLLIEKK